MSLYLPLGILVLSGFLAISSVAPALFYLQLVWILLGTLIIFSFRFFDWRVLVNYRWVTGGLYALSIFLLLAAFFGGHIVRGTRSWIVLGPVNFQPVELVKVALILLFAGYFSRRHLKIASKEVIFTSFLFFLIPAALVMIQPDLGSTILLFGIWFGLLVFSGLSGKRLLFAVASIALVLVISWFYVFKDYQRARIVGLFYPERDVLGINYSVAQSKIAIGSSGFWGKGYRQGSQGQLGFLTEPQSDFVLSVVLEEWGVFGGLVVISAFVALIVGILSVGLNAQKNFEKFICLGTAIVFSLQFLLNGGSTLGLTPVIGLPFPFVSYGGSNIVMSFFLFSFINAIKRTKYY